METTSGLPQRALGHLDATAGHSKLRHEVGFALKLFSESVA
jgi:hypothetical protein